MTTTIFGEGCHAQIDTLRDRTLGEGTKQRIVDNNKRATSLLFANLIGDTHHEVEIDNRSRRVGRRFCDDQL